MRLDRGKKNALCVQPQSRKRKESRRICWTLWIYLIKVDYESDHPCHTGPKDAYEQVKEYADPVDLIVCSGGDGTLDEVVTGIK